MACKKTIVWGSVLWDPKTLKNADARITNIHIDSLDSTVTVIREIGTDVKAIIISMEHARAIGLINLDALCNYI